MKTYQEKIDRLQKVIAHSEKVTKENYYFFWSEMMSIKKGLESLKNEAEKTGNQDQIRLVEDDLNKLRLMTAFFVKKTLDDHIKSIQQQVWIGWGQKRLLVFELIVLVERFISSIRFIPLSEQDKENYVHQLREGFELTGDKRFLEFIKTCASVFYLENPQKALQLTQYADQSMHDIEQQGVNKKLNKVRFASEMNRLEPVDLGEPPTKKLKSSSSSEMSEEDSEIVKKFINVLTPVHRVEPLSRRVVAALFNSLSDCLIQSLAISRKNKVMMLYDLLNKAYQVCPDDEKALRAELASKINQIKKIGSDTIKMNQYFSSVEFTSGQPNAVTTSQFKGILADLVDEIKSYLPKEAVDSTIEKLFNDWMNLTNKKCNIPMVKVVTSFYLNPPQQESGFNPSL